MGFNSVGNFKGDVNISIQAFTNSDFEDVIDETEEEILRKLMGDFIYTLFFADTVTGSATLNKYVDLLEGTTYTNPSNVIVIYRGLRKMLAYFTYFEYVNNQSVQNTTVGPVQAANENSSVLSKDQSNNVVIQRWNKGVKRYNAACQFIKDYQLIEEVTDSIVDNLNGTYTVTFTALQPVYIVSGDTITLDRNLEVVATGVDISGDPVVTFNFSHPTGAGFSPTTDFSYNPFDEWIYTEIRHLFAIGYL